MKTFIIYELVPEETKFFLADGDRTDLNGCFVNSVQSAKDFSKAVLDEVSRAPWGEPIKMPFFWTDAHATTEELIVVHCGFIL